MRGRSKLWWRTIHFESRQRGDFDYEYIKNQYPTNPEYGGSLIYGNRNLQIKRHGRQRYPVPFRLRIILTMD